MAPAYVRSSLPILPVILFILCEAFASLNVSAQGTSPPRLLQKRYLTNHSTALCNDGSVASFYYSPPEETPRGWLVYLEGGGFCVDRDTCWDRWKGRTFWTTSSTDIFPEIMEGTDIFNADDSNPFRDFHHVYIPYCSSDLWMSDIPQRLPLYENIRFYFRGSSIFRAVMDELESLGLNHSSRLVLSGTSAGAVAAANHAVRLRQEGSYSNVALLLDSGWFIDYDHVFTDRYEKRAYDLTEKTCREKMNDLSILPCCVSLACVFDRYVSRQKLPTFVVTSAADTFEIAVLVQNVTRHPTFDFSNSANDLAAQLNIFSGTLNGSLAAAHLNHVSVFQAGCGQHGYFRNIPLWGTVIKGGNGVEISAQGITQSYASRLTPGYWQSVETAGVSLQSMLAQWLSSNYSRQATWETCTGFLCNPSCPDSLSIGLDQKALPKALEILFLFLAVAVIAVPATLKVFLFVCAWETRVKWQKHFVEECLENPDENFIMHTLLKLQRPSTVSTQTQRRRRSRSIGSMLSVLSLIKGDKLQLACKNVVCTVPLPKVSPQKAGLDGNLLINPGQVDDVFTTKRKTILDNVTMELKTGQLVGIMGPSGSGKTTLLHVLANRTEGYEIQGNVLLNGQPLTEKDKKYQRQCGMLQQLSEPYFDRLTVQENLFFSAMMRMDKASTLEEKVERVEAIMDEVGLSEIADTVVEDSNGKGISGGQKRRLGVAIQLLHVPTILFLDEPTSGLDATSSLELLTTLNRVKKSNRLVILTIHQPRPEIFNMFDRLLLLAAGRIAFLGRPVDALGFISSSLDSSPDTHGHVPTASDNPADTILDLLSAEDASEKTSKQFDQTLKRNQTRHVNMAVASKTTAGKLISSLLMSDFATTAASLDPIQPPNNASIDVRKEDSLKVPAPSSFNQLLGMELRLARQKWLSSEVFYTPIGLAGVAIVLGVLLWQASQGISVFALLSIETSVGWYIMAPVAITLLVPRGHHVFNLEHADGICQPWQYVIHTYAHLVAILIIPTTVGATITFLMVIDVSLSATNIAWGVLFILLAESWVMAFMILAICLAPNRPNYFSAIAAMVCSTFQGFLVPRSGIPVFLHWIPYLNPIAWAFAGAVQGLVEGKVLPCDKASPLSCADKNFNVLIGQFGLNTVNLYIGLLFLVVAIGFTLSLAIAAFLPWKKYLTALKEYIFFTNEQNSLSYSSQKESTMTRQRANRTALLSEVCVFPIPEAPYIEAEQLPTTDILERIDENVAEEGNPVIIVHAVHEEKNGVT